MTFPQTHVDGELWDGAAVTDLESRVSTAIEDSVAPLRLFVDSFGCVGDGTTVDTAEFQDGVDAASAIGAAAGSPCRLFLTSGKTYKLGAVAPKSNVIIDAHGATIITDPGESTGPFFMAVGDPGITDFHILGANFAGTGVETVNQQCVTIRKSQRVSICECRVTSWKTGVFYIDECQQVWVEGNYITGSTTFAGYNAINIVNNALFSPPTDIFIARNYVWGIPAIPINVHSGSQRVIIDSNIVQTTHAAVNWAIGVEDTPGRTTSDITITNNIVDCNSTTAYGININQAAGAATLHTGFVIASNNIRNCGSGILFCGNFSQIRDNLIRATNYGVLAYLTGAVGPTLLDVRIDSNMIQMAANAAGGGISVANLKYGTIRDNEITYDAGSTTGSHGIGVTNSGWTKIIGNTVSYAPARAFNSSGCNDLMVADNHILNPNETKANGGGVAWEGMKIATWTGASTLFRDNQIIDNRGTATMQNGISSDAANVNTMGNRIAGTVGAATVNCATVTGV